MSRSCLVGLLACSLLVLAAHHASASSTMSTSRYPVISDTCPVLVSVGKEFDHALVPLEETLEIYLRPNQPKMNVKIIGHEVLYKASVAGTMVMLFACNVWDANCTLLDESGTKSRDLLAVDEWNRVQFKYINGEIAVNINTRNNVMGKDMMPMAKGPSKTKSRENNGGIGYLTFVVPPNSDSYRASLKILCDEYGVPPYIVTAPPSPPAATSSPTPPSPMDSRPYPFCPVYQVEENHATPTASGEPVQQSFTFAIYPNLPALKMDVFSGHLNFKFQLRGSLLELKKCNGMGRDCLRVHRKMDTSNIIEANTWNEVTVYLHDDQIFMQVNNSVIDEIPLESGVYKGLKVVVLAPEATTTTEYFVARVNVRCFVMEQHPTNPGTAPTTTVGGLPTKDSIVETTPKTDPSGVNRDVVIAVGVLVGVLLVIAIAIVISTYRKRRSATINEHSPLQNQHQQQDY